MSSQRSSKATGPVHIAAARIGEVEIEALAREACEAGVSLTQHVSDLVSVRAIEELVAPSPLWRAIPTASSEIKLELSPEAHAMVERVCEVAGSPEDVILSNLAAGGPPRTAPE